MAGLDLDDLVLRNKLRAKVLFSSGLSADDAHATFGLGLRLPSAKRRRLLEERLEVTSGARSELAPAAPVAPQAAASRGVGQLAVYSANGGATGATAAAPAAPAPSQGSLAILAAARRKREAKVPVPQWHAPWRLSAVISGHLGWVRSVAFDPGNEWFCTGSSDRTIKIWDLAKCSAGLEGGLRLTLTGHISSVRALAVSDRSPYMFSAGEDKKVMCWDLEYNKTIRHYHGHLSGVYSLALHPTLDLLFTGGRDAVCRVWDIRTKHQIHVLGGHDGAVGAILAHGVDPQVVTGSYDSTIKAWDLIAGKALYTLTHHKKAVRTLAQHPTEFSFVSGAADNLKEWATRDGTLMKNLSGHRAVINAVALNEDGVLASCGDNGTMQLWDYGSGYCFQKQETIVQPGSLDAEAGFYAATFDKSGSRLVTCEADKTIKIWKEDEEATEEAYPIDMETWRAYCLKPRR